MRIHTPDIEPAGVRYIDPVAERYYAVRAADATAAIGRFKEALSSEFHEHCLYEEPSVVGRAGGGGKSPFIVCQRVVLIAGGSRSEHAQELRIYRRVESFKRTVSRLFDGKSSLQRERQGGRG